MEDIDPPRETPGAADAILRTLDEFALQWDGDVVYQSRRIGLYQAALDDLVDRGHAYPCTCTRREIRAHNKELSGAETTVYPGLCRDAPRRPGRRQAWRIRTPDENLEFEDLEVGRFAMALARECGDFVLKRRDGLFAYQLAVVVDDAAQAITEVVRGQDLLDSTPGQIFLQQSLDYPTPDYLHLPVVTNDEGHKLSKQTGARPVSSSRAGEALCRALAFLGLPPPPALHDAAAEDIIAWGIERWPDRAPTPADAARGMTRRDFSPDK